jgi:hypothetical protein
MPHIDSMQAMPDLKKKAGPLERWSRLQIKKDKKIVIKLPRCTSTISGYCLNLFPTSLEYVSCRTGFLTAFSAISYH